jgi:hypothetical protein
VHHWLAVLRPDFSYLPVSETVLSGNGFDRRLYSPVLILAGANHLAHLASDLPVFEPHAGSAFATKPYCYLARANGRRVWIKKIRNKMPHFQIGRVGDIAQDAGNRIHCGLLLAAAGLEKPVLAGFAVNPSQQELLNCSLTQGSVTVRQGMISPSRTALVKRRGQAERR